MRIIEVHNQKELDAIPLDTKDRVYIVGDCCVEVSHEYYWSVTAYGSASVRASDSASVTAYDSASVRAYGSASVRASDSASVRASDSASVTAYDSASVRAYDSASVTAYDSASVTAYDSASVRAYDSASVTAYDSASVTAYGNSQVLDKTIRGKIQVSGNARIVYLPKNIHEFMDYYGIEHTKTYATFYKAVHKGEGYYISDYDNNFSYSLGETINVYCDEDVEAMCAKGIHIAHLDWALEFGKNWNDLAILECKVKISDIVLPKESDGKVRTGKLKIIREVPLEECGMYGKFIERRKQKND